MRRSVTTLFGTIVLLLLIGLYFSASDSSNLPVVEQVSNAEGSVLVATSSQGTTLAILVFLVVGSIGMMSATIYAIVWFLNRQIAIVQQQPNEPFPLLAGGTDTRAIGSALADNVMTIMIIAGGLMTAIAVAIILLS